MITIEPNGRETLIKLGDAGIFLKPHEVVELAEKLLERYIEVSRLK